MNLNQELLLVFKTAIETGSFSATARKLGKAPSAVSMAISQLEDELALSLFDRSKREPQPTPAALSLYQSTLQTLAVMQQWQNHALQLADHVEPVLSIAFATELESLIWTNIFRQLSEYYPLLKLEILTLPQQEALESVLSGRVNFAILLERQSLNGIEQFIEIGKENMVAVVAPNHPLYHQKASYDDLLQHRQIVFNSRENQSTSVLQLSYHSWQTDNQYFAVDIIHAGLAWGFLPQSYIEDHLKNQTLALIDVEDFCPSITLCIDLVWSRERPLGKAAQHFIELVKQSRHKA
ncbi:LysR family transcriptional regulator [Acinetobacter puyangensis]|uniref:DNA-binding transcriptional regulator, LysR family n=1 Tax=Acinetobacter puyangensis TaxID=1096779 RepID=A0A240E4X4_9GAMM|nr:LysR family transcriptional regulator [Acinetobacter puyangensis]SNX43818.1 DNA-binding transcriptional regulator, LysR family [Acinetobacter puyangensis]